MKRLRKGWISLSRQLLLASNHTSHFSTQSHERFSLVPYNSTQIASLLFPTMIVDCKSVFVSFIILKCMYGFHTPDAIQKYNSSTLGSSVIVISYSTRYPPFVVWIDFKAYILYRIYKQNSFDQYFEFLNFLLVLFCRIFVTNSVFFLTNLSIYEILSECLLLGAGPVSKSIQTYEYNQTCFSSSRRKRFNTWPD